MSVTVLLVILYLTCKGIIFIPTNTLQLYDVLSDMPLNLQNVLSPWFILRHLYSKGLLRIIMIYEFQIFCFYKRQQHPPQRSKSYDFITVQHINKL